MPNPTSKTTPKPEPKPNRLHVKLSERPRVEIIDGVRFETVTRPGGITIVSDAPLGPSRKNLESDMDKAKPKLEPHSPEQLAQSMETLVNVANLPKEQRRAALEQLLPKDKPKKS